ncbi:hypothetical protein EDD37DRAFT_620225 [Exophiala viscosa]|uniref:uncharacterized protein n=1 Tax=Exophiala viscosa TaxID=2486360 RepID=UPI002191E946|nr:hypothetical protein EDD37DRAFT_620225 [Exophiala viscosa]
MTDSDSSSLSSAPSSDDEEMVRKMSKPVGLDRYFKPAPKQEHSPEPPKRAPSPPHDYTFADNDAIAFIVAFRARFHEAFPKSLLHFGPQDIERGISGDLPDEQVERLLCNLLGLVLNRKKDVERAHYGKAFEEAMSSNQNQWPTVWKGVNPLRGGKNFNNMTPEERLYILKALALWSLNSSEVVQGLIKESYKQTRRDDDKNQPRSVQPWFSDQYRRKYWLIEGLEDSYFRIYRENDGRTAKTNTWFSVAGSIEEVNSLADKFAEEHGQNSKVISDKLRQAIPRFEAGEEKRRRRDYRLARKAAFTRPEPGFSLYEGRTRGKRTRYTYSDDEFGSDGLSSRRSTRISTPADAGPTITASGRQVKSRVGGMYGETMLIDQRKELERVDGEGHFTESDEDMPTTAPNGRSVRTSRSGRPVKAVQHQYTNGEESASDEAQSTGKEWSGDENELDASEPDFDAEDEDDDDDEMSDEGLDADELAEDDNTQGSLVVQLRYRKGEGATNADEIQPPPPQPQQLINGKVFNKDLQVPDPLKQVQPNIGHPVLDTIDVAPRAKEVNGGQAVPNGVENEEHPVLSSPQSQTQKLALPMDLS